MIEELEDDQSTQRQVGLSETPNHSLTTRVVVEKDEMELASLVRQSPGSSKRVTKEQQSEDGTGYNKKQKMEATSNLVMDKSGSKSQGGGGWPSTAARSP